MSYSNIDNKWKDKLPELKDTLRPFQQHTLNKALARGGRLLIADEMGCGKTIQSIAIAMYYVDEGEILIVCPSSLKYNWKAEILKFTQLQSHEIYVIDTAKEIGFDKDGAPVCFYDNLIKKQNEDKNNDKKKKGKKKKLEFDDSNENKSTGKQKIF